MKCDKGKDAITSAGQEARTAEAFRTQQLYANGAKPVSPGLSGMDAISKGITVGTVHDVTPPGGEHVVRALKKEPGVENPWAVAWQMKKEGKI